MRVRKHRTGRLDPEPAGEEESARLFVLWVLIEEISI